MPKISVLVPLYHTHEGHLREAVESILSQTFSDFELLLLNDSPDNARLGEIIAEYHDSRIRFAANERNLGITPTRNKLIDMASGEYLAIMDHDDIAKPDRLLKQAAYLDSHPEVGVVGCWVQHFPVSSLIRHPVDDHTIRLGAMEGCMVPHSGAMVRKSLLMDTGIRYEEAFSPSEDYALWCRLLPHTRFHNIPEVLMLYRLHPDNTSKHQHKEMINATAAVRAMVRANNPALYAEFLMRARDVFRIHLFGFIPFLKIQRHGIHSTVYLFGSLPLFSIKHSIKM